MNNLFRLSSTLDSFWTTSFPRLLVILKRVRVIRGSKLTSAMFTIGWPICCRETSDLASKKSQQLLASLNSVILQPYSSCKNNTIASNKYVLVRVLTTPLQIRAMPWCQQFCNVSYIYKRGKCTLVQALRLCTGRTAHRVSSGIALWSNMQ
jgi:hypothetical protein